MRHILLEKSFVLEISGRDCLRYLNSRTTQNFKALSFGQTASAAMLTPQGRCEGVFFALSVTAEKFLLISDGGDKSAISAAFKRYIVADRVTVTDRDDLKILHLIEPPSAISISGSQVELPVDGRFIARDELLIVAHRRCAAGVDLIAGSEQIIKIEPELSKSSSRIEPEAFQLLRTKSGVPAFPEEINEKTLFSETGLQSALALNKGCFVGQEVVEKIAAVGKAPRHLFIVSFKGNTSGSEDAVVRLEDEPIGKVISLIFDPSDDRSYGFAMLKNDPGLVGIGISVGNLAGKVEKMVLA